MTGTGVEMSITITDRPTITEEYRAMKAAESSARAARIDALAVDRSRYTDMPARPWSPEAETMEAKLSKDRQEVTLQERMDTWRVIFRGAVPAR